MKSWYVEHRWEPDYGSEIIFAETGGQAKAYALSLDTFEDSSYTDLRVTRAICFDEYYTEGKKRMDFDNDDDRIALCKHGLHCYTEYVDYDNDCPNCPAKDFCSLYEGYLEERD